MTKYKNERKENGNKRTRQCPQRQADTRPKPHLSPTFAHSRVGRTHMGCLSGVPPSRIENGNRCLTEYWTACCVMKPVGTTSRQWHDDVDFHSQGINSADTKRQLKTAVRQRHGENYLIVVTTPNHRLACATILVLDYSGRCRNSHYKHCVFPHLLHRMTRRSVRNGCMVRSDMKHFGVCFSVGLQIQHLFP